MRFPTLKAWRDWFKNLHIKSMDLSLERVIIIGRRLNVLNPKVPVITVAGTNGKGSTVAGLETIYVQQGYRVGAFTSPYLYRYEEQVRLSGHVVSEQRLCQAFEHIYRMLGDVTLTPFEFLTLAVFVIFSQEPLDLWILEVGLGGRFDAVNAIDTSLAIITSIGIDHTDWLGDTRDAIANEKAGIFRAKIPAICGDRDPPPSLLQRAEQLQVQLQRLGVDFDFTQNEDHTWDWRSKNKQYNSLPRPPLLLNNMANVLMAIEMLQARLPVAQESISTALSQLSLPGRIEVVPGPITTIFDVSHNPDAVVPLKTYLQSNPTPGKTYGVFSILADKDRLKVMQLMHDGLDEWFTAALNTERATSLTDLRQTFAAANIQAVNYFPSLMDAYAAAQKKAKAGDRIVVFGSFHTVAEAKGKI